MTKTNISLLVSLKKPLLKKVKTGTQSRNLEAETDVKPMEECCFLSFSFVAFSFSCLMGPKITSPLVVPPILVLILSHWLLIKKISHRFTYRTILPRQFLIWDTRMTLICQVDIKISRILMFNNRFQYSWKLFQSWWKIYHYVK